MTGVISDVYPVPWVEPRSWWRLGDIIRTAYELLTFSMGKPSGPSTGGRTPDAGADVDLESMMVDHAEAAYRVALSITRDHDLAEDVTQDALLKAWQALPTFRGDSPLRNWVLRITHNTAISALRKRREILKDPYELPEQPSPRTLERQAHGRMALDAFEEALGDLDELTRSIVVLREVESLSYDEISDLLEVPLPTVKTRLLRARRHLAIALEGWRA